MPTADFPSWAEAFRRAGYVHFDRLLPPAIVEAARSRIARDVEKHFDPARLVEYNNQSWCPGLRNCREIRRLFEHPAVQSITDQALGKNCYGYDAGQIAIRRARSADHNCEPVPHIDGIPTSHNGLQGTGIQNFTALLGVFLTEVKSDFAGNFTVWPGSHCILERYFKDQGRGSLQTGMPQVTLGSPLQLRCMPGDVVLCHYELAHSAAVNLSTGDRVAIFFRLWFNDMSGPARADQRWHNLTHIWHGWQI